ncbi:MAG: PQQ-binding-like beta-propeller repeat protein [Planctomycetaceae bacterium]
MPDEYEIANDGKSVVANRRPISRWTAIYVAVFGAVLGILPAFPDSSFPGCDISSRSASAQDQTFDQRVSIDVDQGAIRKLAVVKDYLADRQWGQAIDLVQNIIENHRGSLVPIAPGRYVNARHYCQGLLSELSPEGLVELRKRLDPQVQLWYDEWESSRDPKLLLKIIEHGFASRFGDRALWILGEQAWEQGEFHSARSWWSQLLPSEFTPEFLKTAIDYRFPNAEYPPAEVLARIVLCRIFEGDLTQADRERAEYRRLFPAAEGELAGQRGMLADRLDALMKERLAWRELPQRSPATTFAGDPQRQQICEDWKTLGPPLWKYDLPKLPASLMSRVSPALSNQPLAMFPVGFQMNLDDPTEENESNGIVLINDLDRVLAFRLRDGTPAWPTGLDESPVLYPETPSENSVVPDFPTHGSPRMTMTIHEGKLFARLGSPITSVSPHENRVVQSEIVCLDLAQGEGKLLWNVSSQSLEQQAPGWMFEGSPIVHDEKVFVAIRRGAPENQLGVACLSAGEGDLLWIAPVCASIRTTESDLNQITSLLLSYDDHSIYLCTDLGAIAALDVEAGTIRWLTLYPPSPSGRPTASEATPLHGLTAPLIYHDKLIIAPQDGNFIGAFDPRTGQLIWKRQLAESIGHLLGGVNETLVASGRSLWGLDINTGAVNWRIGFQDPAGHGFGRGLLTPREVIWPTHDELILVDHANGSIVRRYPIREQFGVSGGNLFAMQNCLIIAEPNRLVCFGPRQWHRPAVPSEKTLSQSERRIRTATSVGD